VVISLEEKMKEVLARIHGLTNQRFRDLSHGKNKEEIIVLFLAILHLIRDQLIRVEQKTHFDDMIIHTTPEHK
jgi:chromatin segregation and condensation protein Rec8/ScpA/Scc1 (kleisin family)